MTKVVSLLFILILAAAAATESSLPISVQRARQKFLEKKRKEATQLLIEAISDEKNELRKGDLKAELARLASLFLTNEGQRLFELAESIRFSGQPNYMTKYDEALKLEDLNFEILISQSIGWLRLKECAKAKNTLLDAESVNPGTQEVQLLNIYQQLCDDEKAVSATTVGELSVKKFEQIKKVLLAKALVQEGQREKALAVSRAIIELDKKYPTGYFWAWFAIKDEENVGLDEAQSYLSICKEMTPTQRRLYYLDPELCLETASVEKFIKQLESQAQ